MFGNAIPDCLEEWKYYKFRNYRLWKKFRNDWKNCTEMQWSCAVSRSLRDLRDFLRQRNVWMQKDKKINVTKALTNAVREWKKWPENESFEMPSSDPPASDVPVMPSSSTPATPSSDAPAITSSNPPASDSLAMPSPAESTSESSDSSTSKPSDRTSCEKENWPKMTTENDSASAEVTFHTNCVANDFVSAEVISSDDRSKHTPHEEKNWPKQIFIDSLNDPASAKIILHINCQTSDFISAEVIASSNGFACDRPTYDFEADTPSSTDTPPPSPSHQLYESDSPSSAPSSPYNSLNQTLFGPFHTSRKSEEISLIFLFLNCLEKINISTFDQVRRINRLHHRSYHRRPPNGHTNGLINPHQIAPSTCLDSFNPLGPHSYSSLDQTNRNETSYKHATWSIKAQRKDGTWGHTTTVFQRNFSWYLGGLFRPYRASYVSGVSDQKKSI